MSYDIEDIVAVLDGREEITDEIIKSDPLIIEELAKRFTHLALNNDFKYAIYGHMPQDGMNQERVPKILEKIESIGNMK